MIRSVLWFLLLTISACVAAKDATTQQQLLNAFMDQIERQLKTELKPNARVQPHLSASLSGDAQVQALVDFYHATGGDNWKNNTNWLDVSTPDAVCRWYGVTCGGLYQDGSAKIDELNLSNNNLVGTIPASFKSLIDIRYLNLQTNYQLDSTFPDLSGFSQLLSLRLSGVRLRGEIPAYLGSLSDLRTIDLSSTIYLTGNVPASLNNLSKLMVLNLSNNQLSGALPDLSGTLLQWILLAKNQFSGSFHASFNQTQLSRLDISQNQLTGALPTSLMQAQNMYWLNASDNQLSDIAIDISAMPALVSLNLSNNQLNVNVQGLFAKLATRPTDFYLNLANNQLTGDIPANLAQVLSNPKIQELDLAHNQLTGTLPQGLLAPSNSSLILNLSHNSLSGELPADYYSLLNDSDLDIDLTGNQDLGQPVPDAIADGYDNLWGKLLFGTSITLNKLLGEQACIHANETFANRLNGSRWMLLKCSDEANSCPEQGTGPSCLVGNPINLRKGVKQQSETDFSFAHAPSLAVRRHYNSSIAQWRFDLLPDVSLRFSQLGSDNDVTVQRSNGRSYSFTCSQASTTCGYLKSAFESRISKRYKLSNIDGLYVLTLPKEQQEIFDSNGRLVRTIDGTGNAITINYNDPQVSIVDRFGNRLDIILNAAGQPTSITTPDGIIRYSYNSDNRLIQVLYPDNTTRSYHYDEPDFSAAGENRGMLTGLSENGVRFATWRYDNKGRAWQSYHGNGQDKTTIEYLPNKQVVHTAPTGEKSRYTFDTSFGVNVEKIEYLDQQDNVIADESYQYDSNGYVIEQVDRLGNKTTFVRDGEGKQTYRYENAGSKNELGLLTSYEGNSGRLKTTVTAKLVISFLYDSKGNVTEVKHTDRTTYKVRRWQYSYNAANLLTAVDGPRTDVADIIRFEYDDKGRRTKTINALGHTIEVIAFDDAGRPLSIQDANLVTTQLSYNPRGWLTSTEINAGATSYEYYANGLTKAVHFAQGNSLFYQYDDAKRLTAISDNQGNHIAYTRDNAGNLLHRQLKDPTGTITHQYHQGFDGFGQLISTTNSSGEVYALTLDANHQPISQTDPLGGQSHFTFDDLGRLTQSQDEQGAITHYSYNQAADLSTVKDATGKTTQYQYNGFSELTQSISPDSKTFRYQYDDAGNLVQKTHVESQKVYLYQYDALNRLASDNANNRLFEYDQGAYAIGRLSAVTDNSGRTEFGYNAQGQVAVQITTINGITFSVKYQYNDAGQLIGLTYPSGRQIDYTRNELAQINHISSSKHGQSVVLASQIDYLPFGPISRWQFGNGIVEQRNFNQDYRLLAKSSGAIENMTLSYTANGNIANITANQSQQFNYSPTSRLISAQGQYGNLNYDYDGIGNRLSKATDGQVDNYTYATDSHHLLSANNTDYRYSAAGEVIQKGETLLHYNEAGLLSQVSHLGVNTDYLYNYLSQRTVKTDATNGERYYLYDLQGQLIAEANAQGQVAVEYVYFDGQLLAIYHNNLGQKPAPEDLTFDDAGSNVTVSGQWTQKASRKAFFGAHSMASGYTNSSISWSLALIGGRYQVYGAWLANRKNTTSAPYQIHSNGNVTPVLADQTSNGEPWQWLGDFDFTGQGSESISLDDSQGKVSADGIRLVRIKDLPPQDKLYFAHNNHLNTPTKLTNTGGNVVWSASYTPFGLATINSDGNGEQITFNIRFPGQYYDAESGLHYNWHRYYDPEIGRYIQSDPIGLAGGMSTYGYVSGNPVGYVDPLGLTQEDVEALIGLIHDKTPDIRINDWRFAEIADGLTAQTTAFGTVEIDEQYRACLSQGQFEHLLRDLLHEGMHATDSFWQRQLDRWGEPENTANHQSIYDRAEWELGTSILKMYSPNSSDIRSYEGPKSKALHKKELWGLGIVTQYGSGVNPKPLTNYLSDLYKSLYR